MVFTMENLCNHINRAGKYGCSSTSSTYAQSLSEMDFERGIWQAALDGDVNRVRKFLDKGTDPNLRDGSGYTALVNRILKAPINSKLQCPSPPLLPFRGNPRASNCRQCAEMSRFHAIIIIFKNDVIFGRWLLTNPNPTSMEGVS